MVIRMVGSKSLQEKQSEGWVSSLRQLRGGGENDQDEIIKTPASQKMKTPAPAGMISCKWHVKRLGQKISFTMDQLHYSRKILDTTVTEEEVFQQHIVIEF